MKMIELEHIFLRYEGKEILDDINYTVDRGDFVAITGPNGGGKTTLLKIMLKLLKPSSGKVLYFDENGEPTARLKIGYLPQKSAIDTRFPLTVSEVVRQGQLTGFFSRENPVLRQRYKEVAELCGLTEYEDRSIGALSGGQLQRTLLARAIVSRPEVLVLDEPLSYVDKKFEHQIYHIMEELAHTTTIILVSHEMSVISGMANHHLIIDHGLQICSHSHHYSQNCS